jgi:tetratricopeptide (TPR) repeat protein
VIADSLSPNTPSILNGIGDMTQRIDSGLVAIKYYKKSLQIDSNFVKTYIEYGGCLNSLKKYREAISIFYLGLNRKAEIISDKQVTYMNLAYSYYSLDQNKKALEILDSAEIGMKAEGDIYKNLSCLEYNIMANTPQVNSDTLK